MSNKREAIDLLSDNDDDVNHENENKKIKTNIEKNDDVDKCGDYRLHLNQCPSNVLKKIILIRIIFH
jgi:hypothetical protein